MANFDNALLWAVKMIFRMSSAAALDEDFIVVQVRRHSPSLIRQLERSFPSSASLSTRQSMSFLRERLVELRARRPNQLFRTEAGDGRFYWRLTQPPPEPHDNHDDGCPASTDSLPLDAVRGRTAPVVQHTAGHKRQLQDDLQKMADQLQNCELAKEDDANAQVVILEPAKKLKQIVEADLSDIAEKLQKCDVQTSSRNEDSHTEHIAFASSSRRSKERGPYRGRQRKARSESSKRLDRPLDSKIASASKAHVSSPSTPSPASADSLPSPRPAFPRGSQASGVNKARLLRPALSRFDHHRPGTDGDAARLCRRRLAKARAESCNRLVTPPTAASNADGKPDSSTGGTASNQDATLPPPPSREEACRSPRPNSPDRSRVLNLQVKHDVQPLPRHDYDSAAKDENSTRRRKVTTKSLDLKELNKSRRSFIRRPKKIAYKCGKSTGFATNVEPEFVVFEGRRDVPNYDDNFGYPTPDVEVEAVDDSDIDSYPCLGSDKEDNICNAFGSICIHDRR